MASKQQAYRGNEKQGWPAWAWLGIGVVLGIVLAFKWTGAVLASAVMAFPLMVRAIRLSIEAVDPKLEEAAATLGASPVWVFLTVSLPLILPGIVVGAVLAFAKGMGEFGATITFVSNIPGQTQTLPSAIYSFLQVPGAGGSIYTGRGPSLAVHGWPGNGIRSVPDCCRLLHFRKHRAFRRACFLSPIGKP